MSALVIDTHVVIWYLAQPGKLSRAASDAILQAEANGDSIYASAYASAISLVEMRYLVEKTLPVRGRRDWIGRRRGVPADRFWLFQGIETAIFVGLAAGLLALTVWWVRERIT